MSKEVLDRIFEPFYTTKAIGQGTGLGLSTTLGIVKSHGGFIKCSSEPGEGTTFSIYFPAVVTTITTRSQTASPVSVPRGNGELVLWVDDEEPLRLTAKKMLEHFGYRVLLAADGSEALSLYESRQQEIAVIVTDMDMPIMDGPTAITRLRSINPQARIIGSSGQEADERILAATEHFIPKPYNAETILQILRKVLGESPGDRSKASQN